MSTVTRGKILRSDLANWDGKTQTATRPDATGGTITGLAVNDFVDVLQVYGSGTSRSAGTISAAIAQIGSSNATIRFAPGTWTIDSNVTVPSNLSAHIPRGCIFDISSGVTLTFSGPVFSESGTSTFKTGSGTLTISADSVVNGRVWLAQTSAESSAGVTPTNYQYEPGDVRRYGAVGDDSTDNNSAIEDALSAAEQSESRAVYFPAGVYRTSDRHILTAARIGVRIYGEGYNSVIKLAGTFSANKAVFVIPANGDNDGGTVDGADYVTIENLRLDGSAATMSSGVSAGIRCFHGDGHIFQNLWITQFSAMGLLLQGIGASAEFSATVNNVWSYNNDGGSTTTGQGIGIESANDDATRITLNNVHCFDNGGTFGGTDYGRGVNIGSGSATVNNAWCWGNGAGGIKTSGNDNQHVILNNCHLNDNTNSTAQGFTTTGTFRLLEFNNCTFDNNGDHGLQIAHAGNAVINNCFARGNGDVGFKVDAGDVQVGNIIVASNTNQGVNVTAGNFQAACIRSESNGRQGVRIGTAGQCHIGSIISIDDCTGGAVDQAVQIQPSAAMDSLYIGAVHAADSAANVADAVEITNSNITNAFIGLITTDSVATKLDDSGTDTIYLANSAGQTYTPTNVSTDRAFDADTVAIAELADVVGTLIADLQATGLIK